MTARRFLTCLLVLPLALLLTGCAALRPDHVTAFAERDVAELDGDRRQRTITLKSGVSVTYDLNKQR